MRYCSQHAHRTEKWRRLNNIRRTNSPFQVESINAIRDEHVVAFRGFSLDIRYIEAQMRTKEKDSTTITLPGKDYDKLVKFKKQLEDRDDYSWIAALGLGAFVGFMIGLASDATNRPFFICNCGKRIDLTRWAGTEFSCPDCGRGHPEPPAP